MPSAENPQLEVSGMEPPTGSKMFDWSTQERVNQVPASIWPGRSTAKGRDHLFVGRQAELDELKHRHSWIPEPAGRSQPPEGQDFITVVTNAPGVGKSALVEELREQHVRRGGYCLGLHAADLRRVKRLRKVLLESEVAQQAELLRRAKLVRKLVGAISAAEETKEPGVSIAQIVFDHVIRAAMKLGQRHPDRPGTEAHARIVVQLAIHSRSLDAMSIIRLMGEGAEGRLLVIVDEAWVLETFGNSKAVDLLEDLGDPSGADESGLPSGGVILAGLPGGSQRLAELYKSRACNIHLDPLGPDEVMEMLRLACQRGGQGTLAEGDADHIITELGRDFGEWTHHAHAAGFAAERILCNAAKVEPKIGSPDVDQLLDWMRTSAALGTCQLYDQIAEGARRIIGSAGVYAVVQAMAEYNEVPQGLLVDHMEEYRRKHRTKKVAKIDNQAGLQALLHCGLIGRQLNIGGGTTDVLEVPIPSLTKYLSVTQGRAMRRNIKAPRMPEVSASDSRTSRSPTPRDGKTD